MPILLCLLEYISLIWLQSPCPLSPNLLERKSTSDIVCALVWKFIAHVFPDLETFLNSRAFLHILCYWTLMVCIRSLSVLNARPHTKSKATPMLYFGLSQFVFIEGRLSHYLIKRCAIFCILKPFFYLISAFVSESLQFINTTDLVRVVLEFNKTAVNQSISCRTDDPNASTTLFFNFLEQPVGGRISLDNQVYTIYGVKKTDAGYYQCKATSSQAGIGPIESNIVVFIVEEGKWLVPITGWSVFGRGGNHFVL